MDPVTAAANSPALAEFHKRKGRFKLASVSYGEAADAMDRAKTGLYETYR